MTMIQGNSASPADEVFAITPSDSTTFQATRGLKIGITGGLVYVDAAKVGTNVAVPCAAYDTLPMAVTRVYLTGTTATPIVGWR